MTGPRQDAPPAKPSEEERLRRRRKRERWRRNRQRRRLAELQQAKEAAGEGPPS